MKREYRNVKEIDGLYEGELWINDKFIQPVTLTEYDYRRRLLLNKLESLLDTETFHEVQQVIHLAYIDGGENS